MNPLNKFMGGGNSMPQMPQSGGNNPMQMIGQFMEFAKGFQGNPEEQVMKMLSNGQMSKEQLDQLMSQAKQLEPMVKTFLGNKK